MKLLLTSGGVSNASIENALVDLLGRPLSACTALAVPTAQHGHPWCTPFTAMRFADGTSPAPMVGLGWQAVGLLELLALPGMPRDRWLPWVLEADALLVDGGDATYLAHWLRASGLVELFPDLEDTVWVGVSAGSMVMGPRIGEQFVSWPDAPDDRTLGLVDFSVFPHLDLFPQNTIADAERWAAGLGADARAYAIDEQTAIRVVDGDVEVVSEGRWREFGP
ncbi:Type 1 glutamine amidotransferase-like domain-containing protein [Ornithinimicrobium tianjinense]|uniref:Peptidase E n=1 Tax=Ornithinimicrobium tianjinense TaxID=1195761 RepID=A0A917F9S3_9MICO|nr:Type 1 glutamine amidotransferase-like domain-containing protein [Ornithinimicrobium tianjinense]GGF60416.1 peptidase E [Ornithinimicrobium tianjinense]